MALVADIIHFCSITGWRFRCGWFSQSSRLEKNISMSDVAPASVAPNLVALNWIEKKFKDKTSRDDSHHAYGSTKKQNSSNMDGRGVGSPLFLCANDWLPARSGACHDNRAHEERARWVQKLF
jgi:hypothetical protein